MFGKKKPKRMSDADVALRRVREETRHEIAEELRAVADALDGKSTPNEAEVPAPPPERQRPIGSGAPAPSRPTKFL